MPNERRKWACFILLIRGRKRPRTHTHSAPLFRVVLFSIRLHFVPLLYNSRIQCALAVVGGGAPFGFWV
jgi:hypothetical protein